MKTCRWGRILISLVYLVLVIFFFIHFRLFVRGISRASLISPPATPLFEDREGNYVTDFPNTKGEYGFWHIDGTIPERIKQAFLIIEDREFYTHAGINIKSLGRALVNNLRGRPVQGASTIPMQIARMQNPGNRNLFNKVEEIYTALFLCVKYPRETLLRHYLRIIPQGSQMHGAAYAARRYFQKPLRDVGWAEAALLAAVIKAPGRMNLFSFTGSLEAARRARLILTLLYREGTMSGDEYRIALDVLYKKSYRVKERRPENSYHYLFRLLDTYKKMGNTPDNYTGPVQTTLIPGVQEFINKKAGAAMEKYGAFGAGNIAIIVADARTGGILGYIGSRDYYDEKNSGAINYANEPRSSGSTLKPFLYGLGLDTHTFTPASILADLPLSILSTKGEYRPGNFDNEYLGPLLYRRALANSRNIPAIRVVDAIGVEESYEYLCDLGLASGDKTAAYYGHGLAVGGVYVTLEQLVRAYGILAREGLDFSLHFTPPAGESPSPLKRLMTGGTARRISLFLSDPQARSPSFKKLSHIGFTFPIAMKTGTSQGFRDAWTIGYNRDYIAGVWIGHPKNMRMNRVTGSEAALIMYSIFSFLQPEKKAGIHEEPFPVPGGMIPRKICVLSGRLASPLCNEISVEYFSHGEEPHEYCGLHREFAFDTATGNPASEDTPVDRIVTRPYTILPPQYAAWGARRGYKTPETVYENLKEASISILQPRTGSRLLIDPETPRDFQSIPLQAAVNPVIPEITWLVDGKEYAHAGFPYDTRWRLSEGIHTIQAKFKRAHIYSEKVVIEVKTY